MAISLEILIPSILKEACMDANISSLSDLVSFGFFALVFML